jgi:2-oxo-4-hydroxy-4-carboxy--5-ureidoimidazoline (OHCU) decarboxylase
MAELARLNALYEQRFGFRFVVFVNRRSKTDLVAVLRARLGRPRDEEMATALEEMLAIADDRARQTGGSRQE